MLYYWHGKPKRPTDRLAETSTCQSKSIKSTNQHTQGRHLRHIAQIYCSQLIILTLTCFARKQTSYLPSRPNIDIMTIPGRFNHSKQTTTPVVVITLTKCTDEQAQYKRGAQHMTSAACTQTPKSLSLSLSRPRMLANMSKHKPNSSIKLPKIPVQLHPFTSERFHALFTLSSKYFSTFPHGTCLLSDSCQYLALDGVYHPLWAAFTNNPTPRSV